MSTVRMKKGDKFADIFDSEETIKNAMEEGYVIVKDEKPVTKAEKPQVKADEKTVTPVHRNSSADRRNTIQKKN